jgi:hypothetical protein
VNTRYIVIQFIEIGGDHLDSLIQEQKNTPPPHLKDILHKSKALLQQARKTLYFINATTIFSEDKTLHPLQFGHLFERLEFLNQLFPAGHQILFYLSRLPPSFQLEQEAVNTSIKRLVDAGILKQPLKLDVQPAAQFLKTILQTLQMEYEWKFEILDVMEISHINPDGSLNPTSMMQTLARCFKSGMLHSKQQPHSIVVNYMVAAAKVISCPSSVKYFRKKQNFSARRPNRSYFTPFIG